MKRERIFTDNPLETIWSRLGVLQSVNVSRKVLENSLSEDKRKEKITLLQEKAKGVSLSLRSAEDYFSVDPRSNLTSACLAYYYGLFSLMSALLLSDTRNQLTLQNTEKHSKLGHGLGAISNEGEEFPFSEKAFLLKTGFLNFY